jgi:uncharacterized protein
MYKRDGRLVFSPSDINRFFESAFASWMDRYHVERPGTLKPDAAAQEMSLLAEMGAAHEKRYVDSLRAAGRQVWEPAPGLDEFDAKYEAALRAMREGHDVIYQGALRHADFEGYSDFLFRVDRPSRLGAWSYEVADTKLAKKVKPYFLLQLCAYAKMLESIQGHRPEHVSVITGANETLRFRTDDYYFYFLSLEQRFLESHATWHERQRPVPDASADHGRWQSMADEVLEELDHPCRVAGITRHQIRRLADANITTMTELATATAPHVPKIEDIVYERLRAQAWLQISSEGKATPDYEVVTPSGELERLGLAALPPASPLDVYFDMEGYPLTEGGLEYLFGATYIENGTPQFKDFWAHTRAEEKRAFEDFVDWIYARYQGDPSMHVFHYASYEVSALRRLMGSHATREHEVDALLRGEVFVDLYRVVRQSMRIGAASYSLKKVEQLYRPKRAGDVANAAQSVVEYARWLEERDGADHTTSAILGAIRDYNKEDCDSTWELREWLAQRQAEARIRYVPPAKANRKTEAVEEAVVDARTLLAGRLLGAIPENRSTDPERWRLQEMLAHLIEFHRREGKPVWWSMFDRQGKTHEDLMEDGDCLGACVRTKTPPTKVRRSFLYEYKFDPRQDTKLSAGRDCLIAEDLSPVTIETMDAGEGILQLVLGVKKEAPPPVLSLIPFDFVDASIIRDSIVRVVEGWEATGRLAPALDTFLRRLPPRIEGIAAGGDLLAGRSADETTVTEIIGAMDGSTLSIQGPPGAGKTRVASSVITELALQGARIAISSNSHKAIQKLIEEVQKKAKARRKRLRITKINSDHDDELIASGAVTGAGTIRDIAFDGPDAPQIVGGTAWAFSAPVAAGQFDYLFVDEAGQVSVANLVGMSSSARNIVLLGDQMQLGQPIQGSHPGESGQSALEYLLQGHRTVPPHLGVFLGTTWRLHPRVCSFISGAVYDDKLHPEPRTEARVVELPKEGGQLVREEAGIVFIPVEHEGNAQASDEEVDVIGRVMDELRGRKLVGDRPDRPRTLTGDDVLLVAPYNLQVRALREKHAPVRAGSVDKFQGQEAPVVIVSMCASSGESSPRGIEFLLNANRLNVALSRAESLAIVVGSPELARTRVTTVAQMKVVNLFCRIVAEGTRAT